VICWATCNAESCRNRQPDKQKRSQPSLYWRKEAEHDGQHLIEVLLWQCWVIQKPPCRCYQRG